MFEELFFGHSIKVIGVQIIVMDTQNREREKVIKLSKSLSL